MALAPLPLTEGSAMDRARAWLEHRISEDALACHSAVAAAAWANMPSVAGRVFYGAFAGVRRPHPNTLFMATNVVTVLVSLGLGYDTSFSYTLHPTLLAQNAQRRAQADVLQPGQPESPQWTIKFTDIDAPEEVRSELATLRPGIAECGLNNFSAFRQQLDFVAAIPDVKIRMAIEAAKDASDIILASTTPIASEDVYGRASCNVRVLQSVAIASKL